MISKYQAIQLNKNTFVIRETTPISNALCYLLCGEERALLIDTGLPCGNIKKTVQRLTRLPVIVVNTHAHADHIGSNHRFSEIFYHEDDREMFAIHTDPAYLESLMGDIVPRALYPLKPLIKKVMTPKTAGAYHYIKDGHVFRLGGRELEVIHTPGHTPGSICLLERAARVLYSGDTICGDGILLDLEGCSPPETYLASTQRIEALLPVFDIIMSGHHAWPIEAARTREFTACAAGIVDGTAEFKSSAKRRSARVSRISITLPPEA